MMPVKYGVGGGLSQAAKTTDPKVLSSHYGTLGVPVWSTKADIERRYHELKCHTTKKAEGSVDLKEMEDAYAWLSNVSARLEYDASFGLAKKHPG